MHFFMRNGKAKSAKQFRSSQAAKVTEDTGITKYFVVSKAMGQDMWVAFIAQTEF